MFDNVRAITLEWLRQNWFVAGLVFVLGLWAGLAAAADVTATWANPTQYTDGTALNSLDISQTRIEYGTCSGTAFGVKSGEAVATGSVTSKVLTGLAPGTLCGRAFATAKGVESSASNVAQFTVVQPAPKPPTGLGVTVPVVYDVRFDWKTFKYALNRPVGEAAIGTACKRDFQLPGGYYHVARKDVDFTRRARSAVVVAVCA